MLEKAGGNSGKVCRATNFFKTYSSNPNGRLTLRLFLASLLSMYCSWQVEHSRRAIAENYFRREAAGGQSILYRTNT